MDPTTCTDADLLRRFRETGDQGALSILFERHRALAYRVAMGVVGNPADAEDAAQDAFLNLLAYESRVRLEESLAGLVARMALRAAQRLARSRGRRHARETAWVDRAAWVTEDLVSDLVRREDARLVRDAVTALDERYRLPLVLHYFQGLSTRETADALGITQTAVTTRLSRAVGKLRDSFHRTGIALSVPALVALLRETGAASAQPAAGAAAGASAAGVSLAAPYVPSGAGLTGLAAVWAGGAQAQLAPEALLPEDDVTCVAEDARGILWLGFRRAGVLGVHAWSGQVVCRATRPAGDAVTAILPTRHGGPLIASRGEGLTRLAWPAGTPAEHPASEAPFAEPPPLPTPARTPAPEAAEPEWRVAWR